MNIIRKIFKYFSIQPIKVKRLQKERKGENKGE